MNLKQKLEESMISFGQLTKVKTLEIQEDFVWLEPQKGALVSKYYQLTDMVSVMGSKIPVRTSIKKKLILASKKLAQYNKSWKLLVTYGYRTPEIQTRYFWNEIKKLAQNQSIDVPSPTQLYKIVHKNIAVPFVAGHPAGGAVDVCLLDKDNNFVDCGSKIYDFTNLSRYVFTPLPSQSKKARFILRDSMINSGFAPFDGEWWHFSFGDKEWAAYYKKPFALYDQVDLEFVKSTLQ